MTQLAISSKNKTSVADTVNDFREWLKRQRMIVELSQNEDQESGDTLSEDYDLKKRARPSGEARALIKKHLMKNPPTTALELSTRTSISLPTVKYILKDNPSVFCRVGKQKNKGQKASALWGLVEGARNNGATRES